MLHIKVMPGHKVKLYKLIDYIKTIIPDIMIGPKETRKRKISKTPKGPGSYKEYLRNKAYKPKSVGRPGSAKKRKGKRTKTA